VINVGAFDDCLFIRPAYCHYYFGDYFAARYAGLGFRPFFSVGFNIGNVNVGLGFGYDPLCTYYRWAGTRRDPNWLAHRQEHFDLLRKNENLRPPHTLIAQQQLIQQNRARNINITNNNVNNTIINNNTSIAAPITQVAKDPAKAGADFKFHNVSQTERKELADKGRELQQVTLERSQIERKDGAGGRGIGSAAGGGATGEGGRDIGKGPALGTNTLKLPTVAASKTKLAAQDIGPASAGGSAGGVTAGGDQGKGGPGHGGRFSGGNAIGQNALDQGQTGQGQAGAQDRTIGRGGRGPGGTTLGQGALGQGQTGQTGGQPGGPNRTGQTNIGRGVFDSDQQPDARSRTDNGPKNQGKGSGQGTNTPRFDRGADAFPGGAGSGGSGNPNIRSQPRLDGFQGGSGPGQGGGGGQGGRAQGAGGQGSGQGGGGQGGGRGGGGGPPPGQQKDKDDKGKSSDNSAPRSNIVLRPSVGPDARQFVTSEPKSQDSASDPGTTSRNETTNNPLPGRPNQRINDFAARQLPGISPGPTAGTPLAQDNLPKPDGRERSIVPNTQQSGLPNQLPIPGGQPPQSSYLTKYDYQSMIDRGRSLSIGQAAANNAAAGDGYDRVKTKDPMVSNPLGRTSSGPTGYGYGRTGSTTYGAPRGPTGPTIPTASGIGAPSQSGIMSQFSSGITAPSLSGITAPMASGITAQMDSGISAQMSSGISASMKSGLSSLNSGGPRSAGSYINPSSVQNLPQPTSGARIPDPSDGTYDPRRGQ
jgi:hypothetical protein